MTETHTHTSIIVAYDQNRAIGSNGDLPWGRGLPSDLKRFKHITLGKSVVMGRKTFESIGRPLPQRENIVVSRNKALKIDGAMCVSSLSEAIKQAKHPLYIIGGSEIYAQSLNAGLVDTVLATEVGHTFLNADSYFPMLSENEWRITSKTHVQSGNDNYPMDFVTYVRN